jgi:uncharacterized protein YggE
MLFALKKVSVIIMIISITTATHLISKPTPKEYVKKDENVCCRQPSKIEVTGNAQITVNTNVIIIGVLISSTKPLATDALNFNNKKVSDILEELASKLNVADKDISTTGFNLYPQYKEDGSNHIEGFVAQQYIDVHVSTIKTAGDIIDKIVLLGGLITNVNFDVDGEEIKNKRNGLIDAGVEDSLRKAKSVLKKYDYKITGIHSIKLSDDNINSVAPMAKAMQASLSSTNLVGSNRKINVSVTVIFTIAKK